MYAVDYDSKFFKHLYAVLDEIFFVVELKEWDLKFGVEDAAYYEYGTDFANDVFAMSRDDEDVRFSYGEFKVRSYKYLGRSLEATKELSWEELHEMRVMCIHSLLCKD